MNEARICEQCGAVLDTRAPEGLCPRCVLATVGNIALGADAASSAKSEIQMPRRFRDYELLEEIARGGMGVVYKARQISLDRIVAVKMILFGSFAGAASVQRFQNEARAIASLRHPNIVAVHEVGEQEGQPYFSMDYVEGQSLAQVISDVRFAISDFKRTARWVEQIAKAIHYAHQRGILHRDLKPSNVLIDASGEPHITDFGLAKNLKGDSELTLTGQAWGSPCFIPPEQAAGRHGDVGPHSDVYSLGAILYHLLTGRPPFVAETVTETLQQVVSDEPASPRLLNPRVPRDLETICLKCLNKEPHRRYRSAQGLAEDLQHWLADEPILARPSGRAAKCWRWCRRKPVVATLGAGVLVLLLAVTIGSPIALYRINRERQRAERNAANESLQRQRADQELWKSYLAQARANRWSGRAGRRFESLAVLKKAAEIRPSLELRNEAIACMALPDLRIARQWEVSQPAQISATFDSRLDQYVRLDASQGVISVHRTADDAELMATSSFKLPHLGERFSPNGQYLAVAC